ncbi:unnamed protein product [Rotaria sordida]|uniref:Uncharacterized protein n=1 Tax=Rotaria sordida TaxID=392033 RepID=A0A816EIL1_9BILA|nr:unnamed protein product [Rotaria sordida]CAF1647175.1 unnamed protein product [Rotaria sordida]
MPNMNIIIHEILVLTNVIVIMMCFDHMNVKDKLNVSSNQEYSPLCFCHSSYQRSIFLAKISLSQCDNSLTIRQCHESKFYPPSFDLTQLIPSLINFSHCLNHIHCLHKLHSIQHCQHCQLETLLFTHNDFYPIDKTINNLSTNRCFNLCQHDTSCGFLCLHQNVIISINCHICQGRRQNVTCRCIKIKSSHSCLESSYESTTSRWMQKRGFPAAGILATLVLAAILLVIAIKLIYHRLDIVERH